MSGLGQSRWFYQTEATSGLPRRTDILRIGGHVSKVPNSEMARVVKSRYTANRPARRQ
jgi:hypothetical protein